MKKLILVLVIVGMVSTVVFAQESFILRNDTGYTFLFVYVSDSRLNRWGDDLLGNQVLRSGESLRIPANIPLASTTWDIRIIDQDGDTYTLMRRRLTNGQTIVITLADLD